MGTSEIMLGGYPAMDQHPIQGGVEILLVASCYGNRDKLRQYEPLGSTQTLPMPLQCFRLEISLNINPTGSKTQNFFR